MIKYFWIAGVIIALGLLLWGVKLLVLNNRQIARNSGLMMVLIAIYFFLTGVIASVYQETQDVYRIASQGIGSGFLNSKSFLILLLITISLFSTGFLKKYKK